MSRPEPFSRWRFASATAWEISSRLLGGGENRSKVGTELVSVLDYRSLQGAKITHDSDSTRDMIILTVTCMHHSAMSISRTRFYSWIDCTFVPRERTSTIKPSRFPEHRGCGVEIFTIATLASPAQPSPSPLAPLRLHSTFYDRAYYLPSST